MFVWVHYDNSSVTFSNCTAIGNSASDGQRLSFMLEYVSVHGGPCCTPPQVVVFT